MFISSRSKAWVYLEEEGQYSTCHNLLSCGEGNEALTNTAYEHCIAVNLPKADNNTMPEAAFLTSAADPV